MRRLNPTKYMSKLECQGYACAQRFASAVLSCGRSARFGISWHDFKQPKNRAGWYFYPLSHGGVGVCVYYGRGANTSDTALLDPEKCEEALTRLNTLPKRPPRSKIWTAIEGNPLTCNDLHPVRPDSEAPRGAAPPPCEATPLHAPTEATAPA